MHGGLTWADLRLAWCSHQCCENDGWHDKLSWVVRAPDRELARGEKRIYSRVRRVLWDYEPLRASHAEIFIDVEDTRVRLRGRVRTSPQKLIADVLVRRMDDVSSVTNELIADPEVVRAVADAHGIVILRGEVPSEAVQQTAIEITAAVPTVHSVRNQLTIGGEPRAAVALSRPSARAGEPNPEAASEVRA
ncbi:MAG: BON domain-containing protein [Chloroflexi bacterium]|nr:MAG: BON domain-containing protein [Chloroflexota bacterium]